MTIDLNGDPADFALRRALHEFLLAAEPEPAPALPAFVGLVRAVGDLTRFALDVALDTDPGDPIHLTPRVLRAA